METLGTMSFTLNLATISIPILLFLFLQRNLHSILLPILLALNELNNNSQIIVDNFLAIFLKEGDIDKLTENSIFLDDAIVPGEK